MIRIVNKVSLVIKLMDNIDGSPIKNGHVKIRNSKAINKKDGYYVFVNIDFEWDFIEITANQYEGVSISRKEFFDSCIDNEMIVALNPSKLSPRYNSFLKIDGVLENIEADSVTLIVLDKKDGYLLVRDSEKKSKDIYINNRYDFFEGKFYIIDDSEDFTGDLVDIYDYDAIDKGIKCILKSPLDKSHTTRTKVYRSYKMRVQDNKFRLSIKDNIEDHVKLLIYIEGSKPIYKKVFKENKKYLSIHI